VNVTVAAHRALVVQLTHYQFTFLMRVVDRLRALVDRVVSDRAFFARVGIPRLVKQAPSVARETPDKKNDIDIRLTCAVDNVSVSFVLPNQGGCRLGRRCGMVMAYIHTIRRHY